MHETTPSGAVVDWHMLRQKGRKYRWLFAINARREFAGEIEILGGCGLPVYCIFPCCATRHPENPVIGVAP
jgi:hypothetical protein